MIKSHSSIQWETGVVDDITNINYSALGCASWRGWRRAVSGVTIVLPPLPRKGVLGIQVSFLKKSWRGEESQSRVVSGLYRQKGCLAGPFNKSIVNTPCLCQKSKRRKSSIEKKSNCRIPVCLFSSSDHWS